MMTQTTQDRQLAMYGCDMDNFKSFLENSITFKHSGPAMVAMGLMSDAQEEMSFGQLESARQTLNRAKWILAEYVLA